MLKKKHLKNDTVLRIIFTDLDGTLLDERTYSFIPALPAIDNIKKHNYPIIPCTSKTHQEVINLRARIGLKDPFIVENGSAVFFPKKIAATDIDEKNLDENYNQKTLGSTYTQILTFFEILKSNLNLKARGFSEMSIKEIISHTGLDEDAAIQAKNRSFSEPFVILKTIPLWHELQTYAQKSGFRILRGNRFYHLLGSSDKGKAVKYVMDYYTQCYPKAQIQSIGLGDSLNDIEMLRVVDIPVLVNKSSGKHQEGINISGLIKTKEPGPAGWREALYQIMRKN